ncbi:RDD family protein [Alteromonas sp. 1_MG-2023]|uniref:RDD family protein n=1 Tax=Alteromonas sp. 1_MG-2023 TaxID=3062669 RepID=UPI0026E46A9F|nr:RDD family protein [Alteromonas sp. 1_MG-2023]MDO6568840.1 RDD family protein [Alteromonas sp. 1_MG-2023]
MNSTDTLDSTTQQEYAGFWVRFGASIIDSILLVAITSPILYLIYGRTYWESEAYIAGIPDFIISYIFPLVATILFWIYKSATPGKMALKVKVVDAKSGSTPTPQQSIIRYLGYYVSILPLGLGFFWVMWDAKKQGWHDKMAGTVVIKPINKGVEPVNFSEN